MDEEILKVIRHIHAARIDNASSAEAYVAWSAARDVFEYALAGNWECLNQFDYLSTKEEEENA